MRSGQSDRRVRRTKQLLTDALLALVRERRYDDISVQDILDRADVGRSTFYAHFYDKDDLLLSGFERLRALVGDPAGQAEPAERFSLAFFRHTAEHKPEYRAFVGSRAGEQVLRQVQQFLAARLAERLAGVVPQQAPPALRELAFGHAVSTLFALMAWWFEREQPYSPEQISELYRTLVLPGLCELLAADRERVAAVL